MQNSSSDAHVFNNITVLYYFQ